MSRIRNLLEIAKEIRAIAQAGRTYSENDYDLDRYQRLAGIANEVISRGYLIDDFCWPTEVGYPTPKVDVRAFVFKDERLLMVREASTGRWSVPGGFADVNLTPAENVERECLEETGFRVRAEKIISVLDRDRAGYPRHPESIYKIHFLCRLLSGESKPNFEATAVGFFDTEDLPEIDSGRVRAEDIIHAKAFANARDNGTFFQRTE